MAAAAVIRANYPIPPQCKLFYFEVEIIDKGKSGYVIFFFPFCPLYNQYFFNIAHNFFGSFFLKEKLELDFVQKQLI